MTANQKPKTKKQLNQDALNASIEHRWEDAIALNDEILDRFPRDAEALNRKGRAFVELGKLGDAREAYTEALKADPANMIARRNLQRLEIIYKADGADETAAPRTMDIPRSNVFMLEIGKTWIDDLTHPAEMDVLAQVAAGDKLKIVVEGERVFIRTMDDVQLGQIDQSIGSRMSKLMDLGHEFEVYNLGMSMNSLHVIVRETNRPEESARIMTFPRQEFLHTDLLREREQLSQREESDFDFGEEEDLEDEELEEVDEDEEEDDEVEEEVGEEDDEFIADGGMDDDEEEPEQ